MTDSIPSKNRNWQITGFSLASATIYILILYYTPRPLFYQLIGLYALLFAGYAWSLKKINNQQLILSLGILFRLIILFSLPALSDDFFRFVWDGRLLSNGVNPFSQLPSEYIADPSLALKLGLTSELYEGLNSPNYFTIYPPVLQSLFLTAATIFPNSIIQSVWVMKFFVFLAEIGSIILIIRLLKHFSLSPKLLSIYALNPLVIIELTGNLHFEAIMIFFLLWATWLLVRKKWLWSTIPFSLAVGSKLLPIMLLPLLLKRLGFQKTILYGTMVLVLTILMFVPIFDIETFANLFSSIELYFQKFEFNASIYYLLRWAGFQATGYNQIQTIGKILPILTIIGIFALALSEKKPDWKNLPNAFIWVFLLYFSLASIVHPWYSLPMLAFCTFTRFRWPIVWTLVIPLSYFTYRTTAYTENLWLVGIEYFILAGWIIYELKGIKKIKSPLTRPEHKEA